GVVGQRRGGDEVVASQEEQGVPLQLARRVEAGLRLQPQRRVGGVDVVAAVAAGYGLGVGLGAADEDVHLDAGHVERGVVGGPQREAMHPPPCIRRYEDPVARRTLRAGKPSHVPPCVSRLTKDMAPTVVSSARRTPWWSTVWVPTKQRAPTWAPPTLFCSASRLLNMTRGAR